MSQDDEAVEQPEGDGRHDEEVDGNEAADVVHEKRLPGRRQRLAWPRHVFGDRRFGNVMAQQMKLGLDARRAPSDVLFGHALDQGDDLA